MKKEFQAGTDAQSSTTADNSTSASVASKPNVVRSPLSVVRDAIKKTVPRLMELKPFSEIIVPKDFSQQHFSYTIIDVIKSNSYLDNKKTWEGNQLHSELTDVVIVKNNAISYELERFAVKDCIWNGQEPMLNDVLECINKNKDADIISIMRFSDTFKWDLSKPYLKDQSSELIEFLAEEVVYG